MTHRCCFGMMLICSMFIGACETNYQGDIWDKLFLNPDKIQKAAYDGLKDQTVAVLVDVDSSTFAREPKLRDEVRSDVCRILKYHLKDTQFISNEKMAKFQNKNLNWNKTTYAKLGKMIGQDATRVLIVTLSEFRLHEPGNRDLWRGHASATVDVVELDHPKPDSAVAAYTITSRYPGGKPVGVIVKDVHSFRKRTVMKFTHKIAEKFYDRIVQ